VEILSDGLHDLLVDSSPCSNYPLTYSVHAPCSEVNIAAVSERIRSASISVLGDVPSRPVLAQNTSWSPRAFRRTSR
jgi:hypothetical protein